MKRRISLLLAVVMVLGSFGTVFAADTTMTEEKAAAFLDEKGILKGNMSGDLQLEGNFLRRDSVIMLSRLMGVEDKAKNHKEVAAFKAFKDITDRHYNGYISWAVEEGYFVGKTATKFGFNEHITTRDYSVVLLRALGYAEEVEGKEGWEGAFAQAEKLGLTKGLEVKAEDEILRGQMALMTVNALNTKVKGSEKTLAEELGIELPKPEVLKIDKVYSDNLKEVNVVFNKAVTLEELKSEGNFSVKGFTGKFASMELVADNHLVLLLEDGKELKNGNAYKLVVANVNNTVDATYEFNVIDNALPEVVEVEGLGTKAVRVKFSEPVKEAARNNFTLDGKPFSGQVEKVGNNGKEFILKPYRVLEEGNHQLGVSGVKDFAGFTMFSVLKEFNVTIDTEGPKVKSVTAINQGKVVVEFEKAVDAKTVSTKTVAWGGAKYADKMEAISSTKFEFTWEKANQLPIGQILVQVMDVVDYSGIKMKPHTELVTVKQDEVKPVINKLEVKDKSIVLTFNKNVDKTDALTIGNYKLVDSKNTAKAINFVQLDKNVVTLFLAESLNKTEDYKLEVSGIRDEAKLNLMDKDVREFKGTVGSKVEVVSNKYTEKTATEPAKLLLVFNRVMDAATVENKDNYMLFEDKKFVALNKEIDAINLGYDGKSAEIIFKEDARDLKDKELFLTSNIKDVEGNSLSTLNIKISKEDLKVAVKDIVLNSNGLDLDIILDTEVESVTDLEGAFKVGKEGKAVTPTLLQNGFRIRLTEKTSVVPTDIVATKAITVKGPLGAKLELEANKEIKGNNVDKAAPFIIKDGVVVTDKNTVTITFSEEIAANEIQAAKSIQMLNNQTTLTVTKAEAKGSTLVVTTKEEIAEGNLTVAINAGHGITDTADNAFGTARVDVKVEAETK